MSKICLFCGKKIDNNLTWHPACSKKMFGSTELPKFSFDYDKIANDNLDQGKAVSGVQKKFSLDLDIKRKRKTLNIQNNQFIIKTNQPKMPNLVLYEWIGMKLAELCDIEIVPCGIVDNNNDLIFVTKRIDRNNDVKIAMEDFCQLSNIQTEYKYTGSYEKCFLRVIKKYSSRPTSDKIKFYKIVLFSYLIGNTDMHLKNFSLYKIDNEYKLTPAYDLIPVLMVFDQQEMALTVNGKNRNLSKNDFINFGKYMEISEEVINYINNSFIQKKERMIAFINETILDEIEKQKFIKLINMRYQEVFGV